MVPTLSKAESLLDPENCNSDKITAVEYQALQKRLNKICSNRRIPEAVAQILISWEKGEEVSEDKGKQSELTKSGRQGRTFLTNQNIVKHMSMNDTLFTVQTTLYTSIETVEPA